jgi:uncharacterized protein YbjT (DUF2867 family)
MILVTGAAGKTGRAVVRALVARGQSVRALVRRPAQGQLLIDLGARDIVSGDMRVPADMEQAASGVRAIYHICPNMSPDELLIGQIGLEAARSAGVEHFVYHSVLHPQTEKMPHHWQKLRVEEQLFESGLGYTIMQPAAYMQNILAYWPQIADEGVYAVPYAPGARVGMVDLEDVAEAAAVVLTERGHVGATYELASPDVLSQTEVAQLLGTHLDRPVRVETVPLEEWASGARAVGLGDYQIQTLIKMFRYYEQYGFWGSPRVLQWLLGQPPTTFAAFVARVTRDQPGR